MYSTHVTRRPAQTDITTAARTPHAPMPQQVWHVIADLFDSPERDAAARVLLIFLDNTQDDATRIRAFLHLRQLSPKANQRHFGVSPGAGGLGLTCSLSGRQTCDPLLSHTLQTMDLRGVNLAGLDLTGINCEGVNLAGANLSDTILNHGNFRGANLQKAVMENAQMNNAHFEFADMAQSILQGASMQGAWMNNTNLHRADLWKANMTMARLCDANLSKANLVLANMEGVDLRGAILTEADLHWAWMAFVNLIDATLTRTHLAFACLNNANLTGSNWAQAIGLKRAWLEVIELNSRPPVAPQQQDRFAPRFCPLSRKYLTPHSPVILVHDLADPTQVTAYDAAALQRWVDDAQHAGRPATSPISQQPLGADCFVHPDDVKYYQWTTDGHFQLEAGLTRQGGRVCARQAAQTAPVGPMTLNSRPPVAPQQSAHSAYSLSPLTRKDLLQQRPVVLVHDLTDPTQVTAYDPTALQTWLDNAQHAGRPATSPISQQPLGADCFVHPDDVKYYQWTTDGHFQLEAGLTRQGGRVCARQAVQPAP